ncbi:MAG TPA: PKD domain-containing protein, partial [Flavobacteriales bacterium]|nr:PKD domain-containing protein [Flavobacteriales bacterium]
MSTGAPITFNTHGAGTLLFGRDGTLLASMGEGASPVTTDVGSAPESYYQQALADGMMRPEENVGALRAQMVNSHSGKVLRLDPATGNGIPSNPFYDATAPRAPKSRVWALGFRNPYRMWLQPNTGSTDPSLGQPGTLYIGDVGWNVWEELNVCYQGGMNFGWPIYEGYDPSFYINQPQVNQDAPNPLYDGVNCTQQYFKFRELLVQDRPVQVNGHPNPCNPSVQIPVSIPKFYHSRPTLDWKHGNESRCGSFSGTTAIAVDLDDVNSPVPGPRFGGYAAIGGPWHSQLALPPGYENSAFFADYVGGFIKRVVMNAQNQPVSVSDFASGLGAVNFLGVDPSGCLVYIKYNGYEIHRICYSLAVNLPPVAVATQSVVYGPGPLSVNFTGGGSSDPENGAITYSWNFGDGTPTTSIVNPSHTFTALPGVPTQYNVTLSVTDDHNQTTAQTLIISVNNTPPNVAITSFANNATYPVGVDTTFQLVATVTDLEHTPAQLTYAWVTTMHHNTHVHPGTPQSFVSGTTSVNGEGCTIDSYTYDVTLT